MDFSIIIEENGKRDHTSLIAEKIATAKKFGYRKIALNVKVPASSIANLPQPPKVPSSLNDEGIKFEIYTRLTVKIEDSLQVHKLMKSDVQLSYDLLAIEISGNNEKVLNQFCGGHLNCDILSLELSNPKLCFLLRKANLNLPSEKGILFEINYRDLLASQSIRINTISNARLLVEKCKGKNILFSSGAKYKLDFRSPVDVSCLGELFGMNRNLSNEAVFGNALRAIKHSKIRKIPISNVIEEEKNDTWLVNELKTSLTRASSSRKINSTMPNKDKIDHDGDKLKRKDKIDDMEEDENNIMMQNQNEDPVKIDEQNVNLKRTKNDSDQISINKKMRTTTDTIEAT